MAKCDVIIPVYNAPEYVQMCVFALLNNTESDSLGTVFLLDDKSNEITANMLDNLQKRYKKQVKVIHNTENLGFIKNVNKGFSMCKEKYVMLLNTDCFVASHTVEKLMNHMEKNEEIGLICPICSNAANLTLEMYPGFSYMQMDKLLEKKFSGINYDACTVVGNCLMISKKCLDEVGYLDEIYGMGYGDETDYQFKSMQKGFEAKVALDTYVFHKAEVSFNTTDKKRSERLEKNRKIFFDRWGDEYNKLLQEYSKNDPIEFIKKNITDDDKKIDLDFAFVLPQMGRGTGGVILVTELVNYLSILGLNIGMINLYPGSYSEIMNFSPITPRYIDEFNSKFLIATIFDSTFFAKKLSEKIGAKLIYFSQGYEFMFLDGIKYGQVESSFKIVDYVLTISDYLKDSYKKLFDIDSLKICNGINYDILHTDKLICNDRKSIFMNLRNESLKGGFILNDIIKRISVDCKNVDIYILNNSKTCDICVNNNPEVNINIINGPISRMQVYDILKKCDILVDSSLSEGFGLLPLEAMACGVVPVVSNAMGNSEYCKDEFNSYLICGVNNSQLYVDKIKYLVEHEDVLLQMKKAALSTSNKYDFIETVFQYKNVFDDILCGKIKTIDYKMTDADVEKTNKYLISDVDFKKMMNRCKFNYSTSNSTRSGNLKILTKEFIKSNLYLAKKTIKTILHKDYRL